MIIKAQNMGSTIQDTPKVLQENDMKKSKRF